jgi:hypothetical protein
LQQLIEEIDKAIKDLKEFRDNTNANGGQNK